MRALAPLMLFVAGASAAWPPPRAIDEQRLARAGLRVVRSEHATLVTDVAAGAAIDGLPRLVDLATPQWRERFAPWTTESDWNLRVYLVEDEARFRALGLWPDKSPDFQHGLSLGFEVWIRQQASDYYRRHLLLHEATHSFMSTRLGSCGPGWYMEGMAELCGTHAWDGELLRLAVMPASREAAPDWGRIKLLRDAVRANRLLPIDAVRKIDNRAALEVESYAWAWALCWFLDTHPEYQDRFRALPALVNDPRFDERFERAYRKDRRRLEQEWRLFVSTLEYGYDARGSALGASPADQSPANGRTVRIAANRGWQNSANRVQAGKSYRIEARGRFVIGREPDGKPWPCEPNGVTLRWNAGQPVGRLMATVDAGDPNDFLEGTPIGLEAEFRPQKTGWLFLRLNDSPSSLADNTGEVRVTVSPQ